MPLGDGFKARPWQIGLIVLAVVVGGGSLIYQLSRSRLDLAKSLPMVDVTTGERFSIAMNKGISLPAKNPKTLKRTLLPLTQDEKGAWVIHPRYVEGIAECEGEPKAITNLQTGEVAVKQ